jgi:hypothetical protein
MVETERRSTMAKPSTAERYFGSRLGGALGNLVARPDTTAVTSNA